MITRDDQYFKNLVTIMREGIWVIDNRELTTFVNPYVTDLIGYTEEEMAGKNPIEFIDGDYKDLVQEQLELRRQGRPGEYECYLKKKDGTSVCTYFTAVPIFKRHRHYSGSIATVREIAYQKKLQQKLMNEKQDAENINTMKSKFLVGISHELKTPLNAILGFLDIAISEDSLTEEIREYLENAKASSHSLLRIIDDLLDFSRIQRGEFAIEYDTFFLEDLMTDFDSIARMLLLRDGKHIELRCSCPRNWTAPLSGDSKRIKQVLINLFTNALKFTEEGFIEYGVTAKESDQYEFYMRDTGTGIPSGKQETIFEPYQQADRKVSRKVGGTGIGLSIAAKIVELMGGTMCLQSTPGEGTTFYVTIPLARV